MKFVIAIVPPLVTKERILEIQKGFSVNQSFHTYEPHITIKSPAGLTEDKRWLAKMLTAVSNQPRFQIKLEGVGEFDNGRVVFLNVLYPQELVDLHKTLVSIANPDPALQEKYFEGDVYTPHLTLGEGTWGGLSPRELGELKTKAEKEFFDHPIPEFQVSSVRVLQKASDGEQFIKLIDIPLKL